MKKMNTSTKSFIEAASALFGEGAVLTREDVQTVVDSTGQQYPYWLVSRPEYRAGRGQYRLPILSEKSVGAKSVPSENMDAVSTSPSQVGAESVQVENVLVFRQPKMIDESDSSIPDVYPGYVPFGFFKDCKDIIKSKMFYPTFITGLSGNGKTLMVEQVCAELKRECIRVNISIETDETDLLGGPTLINGNIVNRDGPVIQAMKKGAILLIDEVDRGSNKLMCLQGILEGKPYYNKKNGEYVRPAPGFNIIATANTKGKGSEEGRYLSQILDDAFLERFPITVEQVYPDAKTEKKILTPLIPDPDFVDTLVKWADVIRKTYDEGGADEIISTRRLVHIAKAYEIFKDKMKAIELCVSRFDEDTKLAFIDLYTKCATPEPEPATEVTNPGINVEVPF